MLQIIAETIFEWCKRIVALRIIYMICSNWLMKINRFFLIREKVFYIVLFFYNISTFVSFRLLLYSHGILQQWSMLYLHCSTYTRTQRSCREATSLSLFLPLSLCLSLLSSFLVSVTPLCNCMFAPWIGSNARPQTNLAVQWGCLINIEAAAMLWMLSSFT